MPVTIIARYMTNIVRTPRMVAIVADVRSRLRGGNGATRSFGRGVTRTARRAPGTPYALGMCRSIQRLHNVEPATTEEEVRAAALQYVRKISGFTKPSRANAEAFARAVDDVAEASSRLLASLVTTAPPRDREVEAARRRARAAA